MYLSEPPCVPPLPPSDAETIACELGLSPELSTKDLERRRRAFALSNHPDRVTPSRRALATHRMTLANMLIDREMETRRHKRVP
jgi:hypothetical protein